MKDIEIVNIDYSGKKPEYKKEDAVKITNISAPWVVPEEGPFYGDSLRVVKGGLDLTPNVDFEAVECVTDLTKRTGKGVYLYVRLKEHIISGGGELEIIYQRVGLPKISVKTLLQMLEDMIIKGNPVDWDTQVSGKPDTYYPSRHSHDIKNPDELVGFGGLVELFSGFTAEQKSNGGKILELLTALQGRVYERLNYIQKLKWGAIITHSRNYANPHEVKPADVDLGNLANNYTATIQQDAEGERDDLYSTPAGLKRLVEESEPESEDFVMQSELPFGYYGSGIYLPPPISGSFEGLGGDIENSAFCLEGNGWVVGLIRAYDGRVKNLYYIYKTDVLERDHNRVPWMHTYVQYRHPTITAAGKTANIVINGSNDSVLMLGASENPDGFINGGNDKLWICASNSTFDPNSHNLKPTNLETILGASPGGGARAGQLTVSHVGDWVYLIQSCDSFEGDLPHNYMNSWNEIYVANNNWQQRLYRFPYKDLTDDTKTEITFVPVNVNFESTNREWRQGAPALYAIGTIYDAKEKLIGAAHEFTEPLTFLMYHRKRAFVIVPNPNNKRLAKVRIASTMYYTSTNPDTGSPMASGQGIYIDYDWDVEDNTWTLNPNWTKLRMNTRTGELIGETTSQKEWVTLRSPGNYLTETFANNAGSWIPGVGFVVMGTHATGTPPYGIAVLKWNRDGDVLKDYFWMGFPPNWEDQPGRVATFANSMLMKSPFGVCGFPRWHTDLYATTAGTREYPIEIFLAEDDTQSTRWFYRITEGGADDTYANRPSIQSDYIKFPIYGRKTNSSFGIVNGINHRLGVVNRPTRKDASSRQCGVFNWLRLNCKDNPNAPYLTTPRLNYSGAVEETHVEADGSMVVNLNIDYTLDEVSKVMFTKANKDKQVRVPKSIYSDWIYNTLGNHNTRVIDYLVSFYLASEPGSNQPYSMMMIQYHLQDSPAHMRSIGATFNWEVDSVGADGIRVIKITNIQFPFSWGSNAEIKLTPNNDNNVVDKGGILVKENGMWQVGWQDSLQLNMNHMEILDYDSEGPGNFEQVWYSGIRISTIGNSTTPAVVIRRRNNQLIDATIQWRAGSAFNEYDWHVIANAEHKMLRGIPAVVSGGAMNLLCPWIGFYGTYPTAENPAVVDKYFMLGATYVEGNWSLFINADIDVTFNGYSMVAKKTNWDLRDLTDIYKNQTFYIYCQSIGSSAEYEITKTLRYHSPTAILVATVRTDDLGITQIERRQSFTISGFPLTRSRDAGLPVSSGSVVEQGTYRFIKRSELYEG